LIEVTYGMLHVCKAFFSSKKHKQAQIVGMLH